MEVLWADGCANVINLENPQRVTLVSHKEQIHPQVWIEIVVFEISWG